MSQTLLLAPLSQCRKIILEELESNGCNRDPRTSCDNAYFYIRFVIGFYSFLAMPLFKSFVNSAQKEDPYMEFMERCFDSRNIQENFNMDLSRTC
uniref:Uncharacterized protein n=1 Tax=Oncorhynchus mykiss TaxID=8022 RepID=A0A8K9X015_ONCMY